MSDEKTNVEASWVRPGTIAMCVPAGVIILIAFTFGPGKITDPAYVGILLAIGAASFIFGLVRSQLADIHDELKKANRKEQE